MSLRKKTVFRGIATALITPFSPEGIDFRSMGRLIEWQIEAGADALLVAGTTGECSTLTYAEHHDLIAFAKRQIRGRVPLLAGCGSNVTERAVEMARAASHAGADALLAVTPYYNKASHTGLILHYRAIADASHRPLMLYNVPSRTGVNMTMEQYKALSEHPNIVGVKEASGDLCLLERLVRECGDGLDIYTGNDDQLLPALKLGAAGGISVCSNLMPRETGDICRLYWSGEEKAAGDLAGDLLPLQNALFAETNPIPVKYAMAQRGFCKPLWRLPLYAPTDETKKRIDALL